MRTPRLLVVDRIDSPADLNGLIRFSERPNLVSARVPSHFKRALLVSAVALLSKGVGQYACVICELTRCYNWAEGLFRADRPRTVLIIQDTSKISRYREPKN